MYLVGTLPAEEPDRHLNFETNVASIEELERQRTERLAAGKATSQCFSFEVKKQANNVWVQWISIGRARNNDIVLAHSSVSKLHARIRFAHEHGRDRFWITDAGSTSGTKINGIRLEGQTEYELFKDDRVHVGNVECRFKKTPDLENKTD